MRKLILMKQYPRVFFFGKKNGRIAHGRNVINQEDLEPP